MKTWQSIFVGAAVAGIGICGQALAQQVPGDPMGYKLSKVFVVAVGDDEETLVDERTIVSLTPELSLVQEIAVERHPHRFSDHASTLLTTEFVVNCKTHKFLRSTIVEYGPSSDQNGITTASSASFEPRVFEGPEDERGHNDESYREESHLVDLVCETPDARERNYQVLFSGASVFPEQLADSLQRRFKADGTWDPKP